MELEEDSGVGFGRNALVAAALKQGFKYMVMSDDDFMVPDVHLLPQLAQSLSALKADAVAPLRCDYERGKNYKTKCGRGTAAAMLISPERELVMMVNVTRPYDDDRIVHSTSSFQPSSLPERLTAGHKLECYRSDLIQQFFLARTEVMVGKWDPVLKNNDHFDAMMSMKKAKLRLFTCRGMHIAHVNPAAQKHTWSPALIAYKKKRVERWTSLLPHIFMKWDLQAMWDEAGRRWFIDPVTGKPKNQYGPYLNKKKHGIMEHGWPTPDKFPARGTKELAAMNSILNRYRPTYDQIEILDGSAKVTTISPCQIEIYLKATHVRYPSRIGAAAKESEWSKSATVKKIEKTNWLSGYFVPDECPVLEGLLTLLSPSAHTGNRILPAPTHLYYVSVTDRAVEEMIGALRKQGRQHSVTLVLVVMGTEGLTKTDKHWRLTYRTSLEAAGITLEIIDLGAPFGRAIGMRAGYAHVNALATKRLQPASEVVIQSLDGSLLVPHDFSARIVQNVRCGLLMYAPISQKEVSNHHPNAKKSVLWRDSSFGNFAMCLSDYNALVLDGCGWRESWWYFSGGMDIDMMHQLRNRLIIHRPMLEGLMYIGSAGSRTSNPTYYKHSNTYPDNLPIVPISQPIGQENAVLRPKLLTFLRKKVPSLKFEDTAYILVTGGLPELTSTMYSIWAATAQIVVVSRAEAEAETYVQSPWRRKSAGLVYGGLYDPRDHSMESW
jgi:hypothetical protein